MQGDPRDEATDVSALVSRPHFERVDGFVSGPWRPAPRRSSAAAPTRSSAACTTPRRSWPTPSQGSEILTEEVFGPVLTVQTFATEEQGVRDGQQHPLRAGGDAGHRRPRARRAGQPQLNAGTVWVNCFFVRDLGAPFGGNGKSGIGREGGIWSFDFYSDIKNTVFAPNGWTVKHAKVRNANG